MSVASQARKELLRRILVVAGVLLALVVGGVLGGTAFAVRDVKPKFDFGAGHSASVWSVAWSPDGKHVASGSGDNTVKVWEAGSGQLLKTLTGHSDIVWSVAWSPDGKQLASGGSDNSLRVWEAESGQLLRTLIGHSVSVLSVGWSPDGKQLVSGSGDLSVKVWDAGSGHLLRTLTGHSGSVWSVAWSPDGKRLTSGSWDKTVKVWEADSGHLQRTLTEHSDSVLSVAWSPDGKQLASGCLDNTVNVWDAGNGQVLRRLTGHSARVRSVAWSPNAEKLASGSRDGTVKVWDAGNGRLLRTLTGHSANVLSVAWSPNGEELASGSGDKTAKVWDARRGRLRQALAAHSTSVLSVAWSPEGTQLASGSAVGEVRVREADTWQLMREFNGHAEAVWSVAWTRDGNQIASGGVDKSIKLWDVKSGHILSTLTGHVGRVWSVAYKQDGKELASGSTDATVGVWDIERRNRSRTLTGHSGRVWSVDWSPDGKQLASGSEDKSVKIWEAETGQEVRSLIGHTSSVLSVAWSPNGKQLASGSADNTVKVWEAGTGRSIGTLTGHAASVWSVGWSPDGKQLASSSADKTIRVWDGPSGRLLGTFSGHAAGVLSIAWSPDGRQLATGSGDGAIGIWSLTREHSNVLLANFSEADKRLLLDPITFAYECHDREDETVWITFGDEWDTRYRLADFRDLLRVADLRDSIGKEPDVALRPSVLIESSAFLRRNLNVFGVFGLVYFAGAGGLLWGARARNTVELARRFFPQAGYEIQRAIGLDVFVLSGDEPAFAAAWPQPEEKLIESIARHRKGATGRYRLYLICRESDPASVSRIGTRLSCTVIPLDSSRLERAIADENAKATLREMEEPFLARTDPYDESMAIKDPAWFFGRAGLLDELPTALRQGHHAGVFGLRKVGKTSLLSQLRLRMIDVPVVWLDCLAYDPVAADLLRVILSRLGTEAKRLQALALPAAADGSSVNELRDKLIALHDQWKGKSSERFILIIDEIDKWFPDRHDPNREPELREFVKLFRILRALAQERGMLTILVAAYRPDVNRQNLLQTATGENPMYMSFQEKFVGFFGEKDTRQMIREIGAWKEIVWSEEALDLMYPACGGHPMLTRFLASDACAQGTRKQVGVEDVERVCEKIRGNFRKHRIGVYFEESVWAVLREDERDALLWMASGQDGSAAAEWADALVNLEHFGLISGVDVNGNLFRDWLRGRSD